MRIENRGLYNSELGELSNYLKQNTDKNPFSDAAEYMRHLKSILKLLGQNKDPLHTPPK